MKKKENAPAVSQDGTRRPVRVAAATRHPPEVDGAKDGLVPAAAVPDRDPPRRVPAAAPADAADELLERRALPEVLARGDDAPSHARGGGLVDFQARGGRGAGGRGLGGGGAGEEEEERRRRRRRAVVVEEEGAAAAAAGRGGRGEDQSRVPCCHCSRRRR